MSVQSTHPLLSIDNKPFFVLAGQFHNSSGYDVKESDSSWKALKILGANTAEVPVYWEQIEPQEGVFCFDSVDQLINAARLRGIHLVLLWFGTWKNGMMQYTPGWLKSQPERFHAVKTAAGKPIGTLSPHCEATMEADRKAFCALLAHLRQVDQKQRNVIMVQVENEPGSSGSDRDYGATAEKAFREAVPAELVKATKESTKSLIHSAWQKAGKPIRGNWEKMFGNAAAEYFTAWHIARYIDRIVESGKEVYDIPMYVNVWLREGEFRLPGSTYPSGGPTTNVVDIWKWATPHIDIVAPDIYLSAHKIYNEVCSIYNRPDNPLFIPETGGNLANALNIFSAIANYDAIGYGVFGIESLLFPDGSPRPDALPFIESFKCVSAALPLIHQYRGTGKIFSVIQEEFMYEQYLDFGDLVGLVQFFSSGANTWPDYRHSPIDRTQRGRGLIFWVNPREFYLTGAGYHLVLKPKNADRVDYSGILASNYILVEEGHFDDNGKWVVVRPRNGDEIHRGLWVQPDVGVVHAILV